MKVLIIGAGPVGLTAALEFARNKITPEIVEKRTEPSTISRAVGIMPASINHLKPLGVGDAIVAEGMALKKIQTFHGKKQLMKFDCSSSLKDSEVMIGLPQNRTETLMREALEKHNVIVKFGCEVVDVENLIDKVKVTFSDNSSKVYDWVIGTDGVNSTTRTKLGIPYIGYDLPETWSIADVGLNGGYDTEEISVFIQEGSEGDFIMVLPIEKKRLRIVSSTPDCLKSIPMKLDINTIHRTGIFKISIKQAETYKKGRVLLAGDAAHCHSPVGGKGMNLGIEDAVVAVNSILNENTEEYTALRHNKGAAVMRKSERIRKFISSPKFFPKLFASVACKILHYIPFLQTRLLRSASRF